MSWTMTATIPGRSRPTVHCACRRPGAPDGKAARLRLVPGQEPRSLRTGPRHRQALEDIRDRGAQHLACLVSEREAPGCGPEQGRQRGSVYDGEGRQGPGAPHLRGLRQRVALVVAQRQEIVFTSGRGGSPQLYIMDADGADVRRITFEGAYNASPQWSPRGDRIVFVSQAGGLFKISAINPDSSGFRLLTNGPGSDENPSWSSNGRQIVFSSNREGRWNIYIMNPDGTGIERLTPNDANYTSTRLVSMNVYTALLQTLQTCRSPLKYFTD